MEAMGTEVAPLTGQDAWRDLEFKLVEIVTQEPIDPLPEVLEADRGARKLSLGGKRGQTVGWLEEHGKYLVETFDGDRAAIEEEHLKEFEPRVPEEGGFHLAMPRSEHRAEFFPFELLEALQEKCYCVLQATSLPVERKSASRAVIECEDRWTRIMPDMEMAYMGKFPGTKKVLWLDHTDLDDDPDAENGLTIADRMLSKLCGFLEPICPSLGFEGRHRTRAFVHGRCEGVQEEEALTEAFWEPTFKVTAEEMQGHLSFTHRRKICMMYFAHGTGGALTLHPVFRGMEDVHIHCRENQIVVFRHDICDYTYQPGEKQLCIQAWILREPHAGEVGISSADTIDRYNEEIELIPDGPNYGSSPETVDCMSLGCRFPCRSYEPGDYWALLAQGTDGAIRIPTTRWDHDVYFDENPDTMLIGKAYAQHFGMLETEALTRFSNDFFNIDDEDAEWMDPPSRVLMEVGYDCLYRAGWTSKKLAGVHLGIAMGTAESELARQNVTAPHCIKRQVRRELVLAVTAARLQYTFAMKGPCATLDTACSSALSATCMMHHWMRPMMPEHVQARTMSQQVPYGMACGANAAFNPTTMIGFCSAHMLSIRGRCFTFDQSADGFLRAEGVGSMFYKTSFTEDHGRLSMLVASQMNQDGRSASLTAPHGPSQQECIRYCLREAGITSLDVQVQELHGTGTSLGDPIETGSLRATMMTCDGEIRESPIIKTSSKSNFGHTELNAGMCGIMKVCLLGLYCAATANLHLRLLNPHIDDNAYPVLFATELADQNKEIAYCGVSSFGWSGCNARGDLWSRCLAGPRCTEPGHRLLDLTARRVFAAASLNRMSAPPDPEPLAGAALDNLEAYTGEYGVGIPLGDDNLFYCIGSFSGWISMEQMMWLEDRNAYAFALAIGEACVEQFKIVVNKSNYKAIFPAVKMADFSAQVLGPGVAPPGHHWVVDGRRDGAPQGTVYMVIFAWDEERRQKYVWWEATEDERALEMASRISFRHGYSLVASWSLWKPVKMRAADKDDEQGVFEAEFRIGIERKEAFRFLRDADPNQAIYPSQGIANEFTDMQVRGPDHRGEGKSWRLTGIMGEVVSIKLKVWEGKITVTTVSDKGESSWSNEESPEPVVYYVSASWNKFGLAAMDPVPAMPGVYRLRRTLSTEGIETFQIVLDRDFGQVIHPEMKFSDQLISPALGPDGKGEGLHWGFYASPGRLIEITLDTTQADADRRKLVTWSLEGEEAVPLRAGLDAPADAPKLRTYDYDLI